MRFEWDEDKQNSNLRKHRLDFADAHRVFLSDFYTFPDSRYDYGEDRFITFGLLNNVIVTIVHTETDDAIRIISMRRANKYEQRRFHLRFKD